MERTNRPLDRLLVPPRIGVAAALDENEMRPHRIAQQAFDRERQRPRDHAVDHQPVVRRIDLRYAVVMPLEMQPAWRDNALERLERCPRHAIARGVAIGADASVDTGLALRRLTITGERLPRFPGPWRMGKIDGRGGRFVGRLRRCRHLGTRQRQRAFEEHPPVQQPAISRRFEIVEYVGVQRPRLHAFPLPLCGEGQGWGTKGVGAI